MIETSLLELLDNFDRGYELHKGEYDEEDATPYEDGERQGKADTYKHCASLLREILGQAL